MPESQVTKKALAASLKELMLGKPLDKISVGDICARCGMSRKSFYYHFKDKYDLVNWIFDSEFLQALRLNQPKDAWEYLHELCRYFYDNKAFYIRAFSVSGQNSFGEYFTDISETMLHDAMLKEFGDIKYSRFYAQFFTDAFRMAIERWLKENAQIEPDEFVEMFQIAVAGLVRKYMDDNNL